MGWLLTQGDCLDRLRVLDDATVDSVVSDPPAGIGFMGREWDSDKGGREPWIGWMTRVMQECFRVVKPGGHLLIWAIPRTSHWTATAIEDAGFEIRDVITHHFGSGFPKSQDVGKFIDKLAGAEREVVGTREQRFGLGEQQGWNSNSLSRATASISVTAPATSEAKTWDGWGTALKPATEHWILARKPLSESSIARNLLTHGTGALNIDACRVERAADDVPGWHKSGAKGSNGYLGSKDARSDTFAIRDMSAEEIQERCGDKGRWPTNLLLSHDETCGFEDGECAPWCPVAELDRQSSGAARFFPTFRYQAKPSRSEKESGLATQPERTLNRVNPGGIENDPRWAPLQVKNNHPTVKSKRLMKWLISLVTPPGGLVLDPFAGSGSTGVAAVENGYSFIGFEKDPEYCQIASARIQFAAAEAAGQMSLFDEEEL